MRVLVCPTEFKGTLTAARAARAMARGIRRARPGSAVDVLPLSDGGPGLLDALVAATHEPEGPRLVRTAVEDPLGRPVEGRLLFLSPDGAPTGPREETGVGSGGITVAAAESADACGLRYLSPEERRPAETGTEGVGDLVRAAAARGVDRLYLGLGGSGTCDGGAGAARRLGWRFLDADGGELGRGGGALHRLSRVVEPPEEEDVDGSAMGVPELVALADVENPLLGPRGAARIFGPQKGASPEEVELLEDGLDRLAALSPRPALRHRPGAGAAGGLAFGCGAFLGASIVAGAPWVLERVGFADRLARTDLVVTGEGAFDATTGMGKIVGRVLRRARDAGVAAGLVCGRLETDPPAGVRALDGGGRMLDGAGVEELAAALVRDGGGPVE